MARLTLPWTRLTKDTPPAAAPSELVVPDPAKVAATMHSEGMDYTRAFSPGAPLTPFTAPSGEARRFDFPTGYNIIARPERDRRVSFSVLKGLIDSYDVARMAIGHRIDDVRSLKPQIHAKPGYSGAEADADVERAYEIMRRPEGGASRKPFFSWLAAYLEDVLRYDAGTLFRRRNMAGQVIGLKVVSGTTIAPLLDYYGDTPEGDAPAYVQFANGVPWDWFTQNDVIYQPFRPQSDSPYGMAPLESVLLNVNTDLRMQSHFLSWFTDGTIPEGFATAPEDQSSPDQLTEWQEAWDALLYGDDSAKHQLKWVPSGTEFSWPKDKTFDQDFALFLMRKTAAAYHVTPNDLGWTEDVNRATGDTQVDVQFRIGTKPMLTHIGGIITDYLQDDRGLAVEFEFDEGQEKEDRLSEAQAHKLYVDMGAESPDEVRESVLGLPIDSSRPIGRFYAARQGPVPLTSIESVAGPTDPETYGPRSDAPVLEQPYVPPVSVVPAVGTSDAKASLAATDAAQVRQRAQLAEADATIPVVKDMTGGVTAATGITGVDLAGKPSKPRGNGDEDDEAGLRALEKDAGVPVAAGVAVRADDTGRVLMLQRSLSDTDPAAGAWEFPGGCLNPGEDPLTAGIREWQEEVGVPLPPGMWTGSWESSDGVYRCHVLVIPAEADLVLPALGGQRQVLNPDDPDGDCPEVCAWWDVDDAAANPALRGELAADVAAWSSVLAGARLPGGEDIRKALGQWRRNATTRVDRGQVPRRFDTAVIPAQVADQVWGRLAKASSRDDVAGAFRTVVTTHPKGSWRDGGRTPMHAYDLALTDHYAPLLASALAALLPPAAAAAAAAAGAGRLAKAEEDPVAQVVRAVLEQQITDTGALEHLIRQMYADGWLAGEHAADQQLTAVGVVTGAVHGAAADVDWDRWKPGDVDAASVAGDGGLSDLLDQAGITIRGLTDTTLDQLGGRIADGIAAGDTVDTVASTVEDLVGGDEARAEMIAHTEIARAMTAATLQTYAANGVTQWDWLVSPGACRICLDQESANPHDLTDSPPPAHPRCRCSPAPHIDTTSGEVGE